MGKTLMTEPSERATTVALLVVLLAGFMLRLYSFHHTLVINADGTLYIQQAKALYFCRYDLVTACYKDITILPFFILGAYKLLGDWVAAGEIVSLFFGTATLIPLYLLLRRFFDRVPATCALFLFAVNPIYVALSTDVLRDPIYWFFVTLGLYFFTFFSSPRYGLFLVLSCISFMLASWARFEGMMFVAVSAAFLLFAGPANRWKRMIFFLSPLLLIMVAGIGLLLLFGRGLDVLLYPRPLGQTLINALHGYEELRALLRSLNEQNIPGLHGPFFLDEVRNLLWWIALGALITEISRALFEPFCLIFLVGMVGLRKRSSSDARLVYLMVAAVAALAILYLNLLNNWVVTKRFVATFMFPSFVLFGFGLEKISRWCQNRFHLPQYATYVLLGGLIFVAALPKNLNEKREGKLIPMEIGRFLVAKEGGNQEILLAGPRNDLALIHFYANLDLAGASCPLQGIVAVNPGERVDIPSLQARGVRYLVWGERDGTGVELATLAADPALIVAGEWQEKETGRLMVFKIK